MWFQATLLDANCQLEVGTLSRGLTRHRLSASAWVDTRPGWIANADELFDALRTEVPWRGERRAMYDRMVDVPRLLCFYDEATPLPHPVLNEARDALSDHYRDELGEAFTTAGLCYYRDGNDSVAWHGDRIGRSRVEDTMIAILSLGAPRRLSLRPTGGGPQTGFSLGHGDLAVMGGSCQRTWEHAILKTKRAVGPRISVQFRVSGVR